MTASKKTPLIPLPPAAPGDENGISISITNQHGERYRYRATGENVLKTLKDMMKALPLDPDRIYLTGYSMGGFGTYTFLNQEPKLFAAGIPVAGGAGTDIARNLRKIPLWIFHGEKDDVVKPDMDRALAKALEKIHAPAKYTEIPGGDHGIIGKVESDPEVHKWLFEQKRGK